MTLHDILASTKGHFVNTVDGAENIIVNSVSTDSRNIAKDELFIALKGKNLDGHKFVKNAVKNGACAVIICQDNAQEFENLPCPAIAVKDTTLSLGDIARAHRMKLFITAIAVTGSNGKTTTKEMIYHILAKDRKVIRSAKSFNNQIGVPLTIMEIDQQYDHAVLELGTSGFGEIAYLAGIVQPGIGVITNVSETHLMGLASIEGVARAKAELLEFIDPQGFAVLNADNEWTNRMATAKLNTSVVTFGLFNPSNIKGSDVQTTPNGIEFYINDSVLFRIPVMGMWNVYNALAAITVCYTLGYSFTEIANRLENFTLPPMRMEKSIYRGITFINDAYNANPRSMLLATDDFSMLESKGRKILVLGDMLELGEQSRYYHEKLAATIKKMEIDAFVGIGREMRYATDFLASFPVNHVRFPFFHFQSSEEASEFLLSFLKENDAVFLKGSRGIAVEKILDKFIDNNNVVTNNSH